MTAADYRGTVWIADFIFTRCGGSCPILSSRMLALSKKTSDVPAIRYVSFGVDPEYDTPEVLATYARELGADPARWTFLHGERPVIRALIKDGFKLAIEDGPADSVEPILHSTRFVLVDGEGTIRGYYDGMEQAPVDALERDARALWEKLVLDSFQAGLSWYTILRKRDNFRAAFVGFRRGVAD